MRSRLFAIAAETLRRSQRAILLSTAALTILLASGAAVQRVEYSTSTPVSLKSGVIADDQNEQVAPPFAFDRSRALKLTDPASAQDQIWWREIEPAAREYFNDEAPEDSSANLRRSAELVTLDWSRFPEQIRIAVHSSNADFSVRLGNAFAASVAETVNAEYRKYLIDANAVIENKLREATAQLQQAETEISSKTAGQAAWNEHQAASKELSELTRMLSDISAQRLDLRAALQSESSTKAEAIDDYSLENWQNQLVETDQDLGNLTKTLGAKHPQVQELQYERKRIESLIEARLERSRSALEARSSALEAREAAVRAKIEETSARERALASAALEFQTARTQLESHKQAHQWWANKLAWFSTTASQSQPYAWISAPAGLSAVSDNRLPVWWIAPLLAAIYLTISAGTVLRAVCRPNFVSIRHLEAATGISALVQIPHMSYSAPAGNSGKLLVLPPVRALLSSARPLEDNFADHSENESNPAAKPRTKIIYLLPEMEIAAPEASVPLRNVELENAFRRLRNELMVTAAPQARVFSITSSSEGEGKTTVACNLAHSFAKSGHTVVLVDVDMRHISTSQRIQGLADYLHDAASIKSIVYQCAMPYMFTVAAGNIGPNTRDLLYSKAMKDFVDHLRNLFDYVILDSPAMRSNGETDLFGELSDSVLYVVDPAISTKGLVEGCLKELQTNNCSLAGLVINEKSSSALA